jgi:hypothetical protein
MNKPKSQDDYIKTALRLPRGLHALLIDAAEANGRSLNAEIIARLLQQPLEAKLEELSKQNLEIKSLAREILHSVASQQ